MDPFLLAVAALVLVAVSRRGAGTTDGGGSGGDTTTGAPSFDARRLSALSSRALGAVASRAQAAIARSADRDPAAVGPFGGAEQPLSGWVESSVYPGGYWGDDLASWMPLDALRAEVPFGFFDFNGRAYEPRAIQRDRRTPWTLGEFGGWVAMDADGVLWLTPSGQNNPTTTLGARLRSEFAATGKTERTSAVLWRHDAPRLVRSGGAWIYQGHGAAELAGGARFSVNPLDADRRYLACSEEIVALTF